MPNYKSKYQVETLHTRDRIITLHTQKENRNEARAHNVLRSKKEQAGARTPRHLIGLFYVHVTQLLVPVVRRYRPSGLTAAGRRSGAPEQWQPGGRFTTITVRPRLGRAVGQEHAEARLLADAGQLIAALTADPVRVVGEERLDELPRAPPGHPRRRLVADAGREGDGGRRQKNEGQEEEKEGHVEPPPERHC